LTPAKHQYLQHDVPLNLAFFTALEHIGLGAVTLILPKLIAQAAGADATLTAQYMSLAMIGLGIATLLQAYGKYGIGSGFLLPASFTTIFIPPAMAAAHSGGLAAVAGLSIVAGLTEMILSRLISHLRRFIPTEIMGFTIMMIGIMFGLLGLRLIFGINAMHVAEKFEPFPALFGLVATIFFSVWGPKKLRPIAVLIGIIVGCITYTSLCYWSGENLSYPLSNVKFVMATWPLITPSFSTALIPGFIVGGIASMLRSTSDIVASQQILDPNWKRPDFKNIQAGTLASGLSTLIAGALGVLSVNTNTGSVGLVAASGIKARKVAYIVGGIWIILGLIPGGSVLLISIPSGIQGAAMFFASAFIIKAGANIFSQRLLDSKRTITIGMALVAGFGFDELLQKGVFPVGAENIFASPLFIALGTALLLNAIFSIGSSQSAKKVWSPPKDYAKGLYELTEFMNENGKAWGARAYHIDKAVNFFDEFCQLAPELVSNQGSFDIRVQFNEISIKLDILWQGYPIILNKQQNVTLDSDDQELKISLASLLMRHAADKFSTETLANGDQRMQVIIEDL